MNDVPPTFAGTELHIHICGAISAALVPWWIHWLRHTSPDVVVNVSISPQARRFVSDEAVRVLANGEVWIDDWTASPLPHSWREGQSGGSQCIIVFPATHDTIMRLAQGRSDSPALMMLQLTNLPVVIASVSPVQNEISDFWIDLLARRSNIEFVPVVAGVRADDRTVHENGFNLPGALSLVNDKVSRRS
ncbi:MAG: CypD family RiPP peptide-cysteine decarboxylase [Actinobacteria bacterium]|nr:CypD family RiPP peptide-cysteine decarboxylase [Actinomycetota bacterium]MCG2807146.1 CypD family RiPP peptide-cysteine decarboxylase [Coriobacteriia bacterium]